MQNPYGSNNAPYSYDGSYTSPVPPPPNAPPPSWGYPPQSPGAQNTSWNAQQSQAGAYNFGLYGPMPGSQNQLNNPADIAPPPLPPRPSSTVQQTCGGAYGSPSSYGHPPIPAPYVDPAQGHQPQPSWSQSAPYSNHPPTHHYDPAGQSHGHGYSGSAQFSQGTGGWQGPGSAGLGADTSGTWGQQSQLPSKVVHPLYAPPALPPRPSSTTYDQPSVPPPQIDQQHGQYEHATTSHYGSPDYGAATSQPQNSAHHYGAASIEPRYDQPGRQDPTSFAPPASSTVIEQGGQYGGSYYAPQQYPPPTVPMSSPPKDAATLNSSSYGAPAPATTQPSQTSHPYYQPTGTQHPPLPPNVAPSAGFNQPISPTSHKATVSLSQAMAQREHDRPTEHVADPWAAPVSKPPPSGAAVQSATFTPHAAVTESPVLHNVAAKPLTPKLNRATTGGPSDWEHYGPADQVEVDDTAVYSPAVEKKQPFSPGRPEDKVRAELASEPTFSFAPPKPEQVPLQPYPENEWAAAPPAVQPTQPQPIAPQNSAQILGQDRYQPTPPPIEQRGRQSPHRTESVFSVVSDLAEQGHAGVHGDIVHPPVRAEDETPKPPYSAMGSQPWPEKHIAPGVFQLGQPVHDARKMAPLSQPPIITTAISPTPAAPVEIPPVVPLAPTKLMTTIDQPPIERPPAEKEQKMPPKPTLGPWFAASLERYTRMLHEEERATSLPAKIKTFKEFVEAEARQRGLNHVGFERPEARQDRQMQPTSQEEQDKKRLMMARQGQTTPVQKPTGPPPGSAGQTDPIRQIKPDAAEPLATSAVPQKRSEPASSVDDETEDGFQVVGPKFGSPQQSDYVMVEDDIEYSPGGRPIIPRPPVAQPLPAQRDSRPATGNIDPSTRIGLEPVKASVTVPIVSAPASKPDRASSPLYKPFVPGPAIERKSTMPVATAPSDGPRTQSPPVQPPFSPPPGGYRPFVPPGQAPFNAVGVNGPAAAVIGQAVSPAPVPNPQAAMSAAVNPAPPPAQTLLARAPPVSPTPIQSELPATPLEQRTVSPGANDKIVVAPDDRPQNAPPPAAPAPASPIAQAINSLRTLLPPTDVVVGAQAEVHPALQPLKAGLTAHSPDAARHQALRQAFDAQARKTRAENEEARRKRQEESEERNDQLFSDGEIGYAEIGEMEEEFKRDEAEKKAKEDRDEFDKFLQMVFDPTYREVQIGISELRRIYDSAEGVLRSAVAGKEGIVASSNAAAAYHPSVKQAVSFLVEVLGQLESYYEQAHHLVGERDWRYRKTELQPLYAVGNISKMKQLEKHFDGAKAQADVKACRERQDRARRLRDAVDAAASRAVQQNKAYAEHIGRAIASVEKDMPPPSQNKTPELEKLLEEAKPVLSKALQSLQALSEDCTVLTLKIYDTENALNNADFEVSLAKVKAEGSDPATAKQLESEKGKEDGKLKEEFDRRREGINRVLGEPVKRAQALLERFGVTSRPTSSGKA